jgi:sec-independent protein translocase protein TatB
MFDFSFAELALTVIVAVIFIGPKELPVIIKTISKLVRSFKALTSEIRGVFDDISRESGVDEIAKEIRMIKGDDGNMYEAYDHPVPARKEEL